MGVEIKGIGTLQRKLEEKFGKANMQRISDDALKEAAQVFLTELKKELATFSGVPGTTGATLNEATLTEPYDRNGARTISVHWKGPKNRYRIIHLNEYGTVNNPNPKGKGAIARALKNAEKVYRETIIKAIERGLANG